MIKNDTLKSYYSDEEINCQCNGINSESKKRVYQFQGPVPSEEKFYNKDQLVYDEALSNLIYVP